MQNADGRNLPATVDDYLRAVPEPARSALQKLRKAILDAAPQAEEVISYQIPTYKYKGPLVHFAAFVNHCSLYGVDKELLIYFAKELEGYKVKGSTIQFQPEKPLPAALVKKIVKLRVKANEALEKGKGK